MRRIGFAVGVLAVGLLLAGLLLAGLGQPAAANSSTEYGWLRVEEFGAVSTGTDGAAVMSATSDGFVRGHVYGVHLDWATGVTSTTDITLTGSAPALTLLLIANTSTDGWYYPVAAEHINTSGAALGAYTQIPVNSRLTASVGESSLVTTTNLVTVTVYWGE